MRPADLKDALRRTVQDRRRTLSARQWAIEDSTRTELLLSALGQTPKTIAMYASRPHEPGTHEAISRLHDAGWRVLLPLLGSSPRWALFDGWEHMRLGCGEIPEPAPPSTGTTDLLRADVIVVACLAISADGTRLGTGGGWYDRALPHRRPGVPVWALASSRELVDVLPSEPHDVPVDGVVSELGLYVCGEAVTTGISALWHSELS